MFRTFFTRKALKGHLGTQALKGYLGTRLLERHFGHSTVVNLPLYKEEVQIFEIFEKREGSDFSQIKGRADKIERHQLISH